jgi:hypothetical protein
MVADLPVILVDLLVVTPAADLPVGMQVASVVDMLAVSVADTLADSVAVVTAVAVTGKT